MLPYVTHKAGMDGVDKERVQQVVDRHSSSKFNFFKSKRQQTLDTKLAALKARLEGAAPAELQSAAQKAESTARALAGRRDLGRVFAHVDMDAFFANVEMRDCPAYRDVPMAVGGNSMLSTANYMARKSGVRSAMPGFMAKELCPGLVIVPVNYDKYKQVSREVRQVLVEYDPGLAVLGLDEACLDLTDRLASRTRPLSWEFAFFDGACVCRLPRRRPDLVELMRDLTEESTVCDKCAQPSTRVRGSAEFGLGVQELVREMRMRVEQRTGLTCSAGVACNYKLAKICSDLNKPNGQYVLESSTEAVLGFLDSLDVRKMPGIGPTTEFLLKGLDIGTCGELRRRRAVLPLLFQPCTAAFLLCCTEGVFELDERSDQDEGRKGISEERTFTPTADRAFLLQRLGQLCESLMESLLNDYRGCRNVGVIVKFDDFERITRSRTLPATVNSAARLTELVSELLLKNWDGQRKIRLVGARCSALVEEAEQQRPLTHFFPSRAAGEGEQFEQEAEEDDVHVLSVIKAPGAAQPPRKSAGRQGAEKRPRMRPLEEFFGSRQPASDDDVLFLRRRLQPSPAALETADMAAERAADDDVEEELEEVGIIQPPDGGYGWVVVLASFMANLVVDGVIFSISETIVPLWEKEFNTSTSLATISPSLLAGCYLLSGPLASALANQYGCDKVAMLGAVVAAAGFLTSVLVPALPVLYFTFGVVGGLGYGLIFLPAVVIVGQYFSERRALATGIAVCGSGIGTSLLSYLNPLVLRAVNNSWRLFLVFVAGLSLLTVLFGWFFKPLAPSKQQLDKVTEITEKYIAKPEEEEEPAATGRPETTSSPHVAQGVAIERFASNGRVQGRHLGEDRPFLSTIELHATRRGDKTALSQHDLASAVSKASLLELNRPLSKADIFYPGSTTQLSRRARPARSRAATTSADSDALTRSNVFLSNIGIPTAEDYYEEDRGSWHRGILSPLRAMLDTSLLTSPSFLILAVGGFLTLACFFVPFMFIGVLAKTNGVPAEQTKYLVMLLGLINLVARVLCGLVSDHPAVDPLMVSNVALIAGGLATVLVPFADSFFWFALYCVPFAFGVACFAALRSVICVELLGVDKLTNAYGILLMFMGVAALAGPPFAAFLKNMTNSFNMSFYVMGALMTLSGLISLPLRRVNEWENRRNGYEAAGSGPVELQPLN